MPTATPRAESGAATLQHVTSSPPSPATPRKRGPKPALGDQPRDRIHDVALMLFERNGISATSMDDVARELGVSRPTLYNYYSTKEDLLLEVVARQAAKILAELPHRLTRTGIGRIAEAAYLGLVASLDNKYVRPMLEDTATPLTGTALETPRVLELQKAFWIPLLQHAHDHHGLRSDRSLEDIMEWIIFIQFSLAATGPAFGMTRDQMRERIEAYLIPALHG
jgi:AcrR family transcriptional regulator